MSSRIGALAQHTAGTICDWEIDDIALREACRRTARRLECLDDASRSRKLRLARLKDAVDDRHLVRAYGGLAAETKVSRVLRSLANTLAVGPEIRAVDGLLDVRGSGNHDEMRPRVEERVEPTVERKIVREVRRSQDQVATLGDSGDLRCRHQAPRRLDGAGELASWRPLCDPGDVL